MAKSLDQIMALIQNHLARAEHPNTPPAEAELARERAEKLMAQYRIEEWQAAEAGETAPLVPIWATLRICRTDNDWRNYYVSLAYRIFDHCGVRYHIDFGRDEDGFRTWEAQVLGYESDVRYAEMLLAGVRLAFGKRLEPAFDPEESLEANALRMRKGGMERNRIALALLGSWKTTNEMKQKTRKVTAMIKSAAADAGESVDDLLGRGNNIKTFRESYADAFLSTIGSRLRLLRVAAGQVTGAVVLSNRSENLDEAFYEKFPQYRPVPVAGVLGEEPAECAKCKKAKSGYCREHSWAKPRAGRERAYSAAGLTRGREAAREVDLGATHAGTIN